MRKLLMFRRNLLHFPSFHCSLSYLIYNFPTRHMPSFLHLSLRIYFFSSFDQLQISELKIARSILWHTSVHSFVHVSCYFLALALALLGLCPCYFCVLSCFIIVL
jgi:hypothetical protein